MSRTHFHTFDAMRFFAFLLVFLLHLPKTNIPYVDFFLKSGSIGVIFFFVLSGFLITYILLYEKENRGRISLKKFFARRILRIWPLFYLLVAFAYLSPYLLRLFHIPFENQGYEPRLWVSLLFAENYMMMITDQFPDGAPLRVMWSICIEEHFYILWGILFYLLPVKRILPLSLCCILLAYMVRFIYAYYDIAPIDLFTHLDYFAFGAIPAYLFMYKKHTIEQLNKIPKAVKYLFALITLGVVFTIPNLEWEQIDYLFPLLWGILFSVCILFTLGSNPLRISNNSWLTKLGLYTYGLYLYHTIIILLLLKFIPVLQFSHWLLLSASALLLTILVSIISYRVFEKPFLRLKKHFY
ncbi:hypothetical protein BST91_05690 [Nonlabens tegetincola]|uniref:acyltransferase family protein n=1 Tax=Nonlabens tegetincola TaxID=323273 RepID=UPI000A20AB83|nr:acyltransferase [Nonlabens tegetincola]ARN71176.1 hypothetical protein BST91_05690 [Nonlabens tegetincola]